MNTREAPVWIVKLPEPYYSRAMELWLASKGGYVGWSSTTEGIDYWQALADWTRDQNRPKPDPHPSWKPTQINGIDL